MRAIAVLIPVLFLGCLIGAAGSWLRYGKHMGVQAGERRGNPSLPSQHQEQQLSELLEMTSEQKARFEDIMKESRQELDVLSREQQLKIGAVIAQANEKILAILNDEQKTKLENSLEEANRRHEHGSRGERGSGSQFPSPKHEVDSPSLKRGRGQGGGR
jgi:Spy/CpxP family protein refolding chaperone